MTVTEPLRAEHAQLLPRLESLPDAALALERGDDEVPAAVDAALAFLRDTLIPHAEAEDAALYPVVERVMSAPGATATMSRDHLEVVQLTAHLQRLRDLLLGAPGPRSATGATARLVRVVCHHPAALCQGGRGVPATA